MFDSEKSGFSFESNRQKISFFQPANSNEKVDFLKPLPQMNTPFKNISNAYKVSFLRICIDSYYK